MNYSFDARGNLHPYTIIGIESLTKFEQTFALEFPLSTTRFSIYTGLLEYIQALGDVLTQVAYTGSWKLWINGSFTTNKLNPNDVDVLSILDDEAALRQYKNLFEPLFGENLFRTYQTDAYFLLNNNTVQAQELASCWNDQFGRDRDGFPKGVVELVMELS